MLTTVDPDDQDGSAVLDLEVALVFVCHGFSPSVGRPLPITKLQAIPLSFGLPLLPTEVAAQGSEND